MKKSLIALFALLFSFSVNAQNIELRNNSSQNLDVRVVVLSGSTPFVSNVVTLPPSSTDGPINVNTWWFNNMGFNLPVSGAYVLQCLVSCTACVDNFSVDNANPSYNACTGTADAFQSNFDFDGSTRDLILHNN